MAVGYYGNVRADGCINWINQEQNEQWQDYSVLQIACEKGLFVGGTISF